MFCIPLKIFTISCSLVSGREILCFWVSCPLSSRLTLKLMSVGSVLGELSVRSWVLRLALGLWDVSRGRGLWKGVMWTLWIGAWLSLPSAAAAGGCKVGAVNGCAYLQSLGSPHLMAAVKHSPGGWQLRVVASDWPDIVRVLLEWYTRDVDMWLETWARCPAP